jgi:Effector Associated Constant Component 1
MQLILRTVDETADPEELDELATGLQDELTRLRLAEVTAVKPPPPVTGAGGPGTRAADPALGVLVVTLASSRLLGAVMTVIQAWLAGRDHRSVEIREGQEPGITIKGGIRTRTQERLIRTWLERHRGDET